VAPVQALLHATRLNLKIVAEWLGDGDFDSAAESAERVKLLLSLCALQSSTESWQRRVGLLRSRCDQLISLASNKDAEACIELSKDLLATLGSLEQELPKADGIAVDDFRPPSSIRNLMKLLDGSYADAKVAKSLDELTALAYTIAEGTNVAQFLRNDPGWRDRAGEVREAAVKVAILKPDTDLKVARQELKNVYERCQACHKAFKR
jgi:hypothetical protein